MSSDAPPPADHGSTDDELARTAVIPGGVRHFTPTEVRAGGPPPPRPATPFPGYEILAPLGDGATGVVYHARQLRLNREVALKVVSGAVAPGSRGSVRFLAEAEAVAAVRHPNVVQVYEYGEHDGRPYLALEYLSGGTLADRLRATGRLAPLEAAALVEKIAHAVQAAHDQGIVHRDLKPHNVLLDAAGEPKVTDFGLAKRAAAEVTASGAVMGTPAYMSPEQARGEARFVGPAADVWALGVILYECLTGRRPFTGDAPEPVLYSLIHDDPPPPRGLVPDLPRDLELITLKCLEKEPYLRYVSAARLAEDLRRFRSGESVSVRAAGVPERLAKWARRKPAQMVATALAVALLSVAAFAAGLYLVWQRTEHDRGVAAAANTRLEAETRKKDEALSLLSEKQKETEAARAEAVRQRTRVQLVEAGLAAANQRLEGQLDRYNRFAYGRLVDAAYREWQANDTAQARKLLAACPEAYRGWEWHHVRRVTHADYLTVGGHARGVCRTAYSPDGWSFLTAAADGSVAVWDAVTGTKRSDFKRGAAGVVAAAFSPDGKRVASTAGDTVRVWDAATGRERLTLPADAELATFAAFTPDGGQVVTAGWEGVVRVWDAATGEKDREFPAGERVTAAALSRDGSKLVAGCLDGTARVFSARSGKELAAARGTQQIITTAGFAADGKLAVTAGSDGTVRVWDAAGGAERLIVGGYRRVRPGAGGPVFVLGNDVACDPARNRVAMVDRDGVARVWDAATGDELFAVRFQHGGFRSVAFSPDGSKLLTGSPDGSARVWDATGTAAETVPGAAERAAFLRQAEVAANHAKAAAARLPGVGEVAAAAVSADGSRVAAAARGGPVKVYDAAGTELLTLPGSAAVAAVAFSPDGTRLATGHENGEVVVWDAAAGAPVFARPAGARPADVVGFSPDGQRLTAGSRTGRITAWDAAPLAWPAAAPAPRPVPSGR